MTENRLNIKPNALFTGDNLFVLNGLNSECVDLIYLDPPFNSKRLYSAPIGSKSAGASFKDMWTWNDVDSALLVRLTDKHPHFVKFIESIEESHSRAMMAYIAFMAQRIFEMHRVLKPTGSFYLHCDPTASHYLKIMLDAIFGQDMFRNEIVWKYGLGGSSRKMFSRKHDIILFYSKNEKWYFDKPMEPSTSQMMAGRPKGMLDVWTDIPSLNNQARERTGYPTQKPETLLERIIKASSKENDVVLDPFCGCATTMVAAQVLRRKWIGIDIEKKSGELIQSRMEKKMGRVFSDYVHRADLPVRDDMKIIKPTSSQVRATLYGLQNGHCAGCKVHLESRLLEVDHIIPKSKGGGDFMENYQLLCGNCNRIKGDKPMEYLIKVIKNREAQMSVFSNART